VEPDPLTFHLPINAVPQSSDSDELFSTSTSGVDNCPAGSQRFGDYTVEGYSRAAVQTYWRIPEMKIGFDLGGHPWDFMGVPTTFVSHTHLDHIAAVASYVSRRRMMKMSPPRIYLPAAGIGAVRSILSGFSKLDRGRLPCELIPVAAGDEIELSRELAVTVHPTQHTITSFGYIVWERRKKLKPEYVGLTGDQIRDIRLQGTEVSHETRIPAIAFTGDTSPKGLDNNPDMFRAKTLITEMTFVSPKHRRDMIHKNGHMHLDDFVRRADQFENENIICSHYSTRYHDDQIRRWVTKAFPDLLGGRLHLWL
jgi:ribonuclease Z